MSKIKKKIGELLVECGLITEAELSDTLKDKTKDEKLGEALIRKGYITEIQLSEMLEYQLGIPRVNLYNYPVDTKVTEIVSKKEATRYKLMPLKYQDGKLVVAMVDPMDFYAIDDLRLSTGFEIQVLLATKDDITKAISKYYDTNEAFDELLENDTTKKQDKDEESIMNENSPIVKLVNQVLSRALVQRASDIHIDVQETKVLIRYRIDGVLFTDKTLPKHLHNMIVARVKIMSNLNITEVRVPQDGRIKVSIEENILDLRVSTLPTVYGEKIVMRILALGSNLLDLEKLGFSQLNLDCFNQLIRRPTGIVLITGPTGSGKSSTLYASLNKINTPEVNIITVEDPVEYQLEGINQVQVNSKVGMTFAAGLRSILRQDPDIVMVGEIRDKETAEISIRASLTGHLVFSTLHTNDSISTVTRLIDMGLEPFLVASSVSGIVAQRLVRRICSDCKTTEQPTIREYEIFKNRGITIDNVSRGTGCPTCNMTGYKGRLAVHEVLVIDENIQKMIMNNSPMTEIKDYARSINTVFLIDDGLEKVKAGLTTTEEVLRITTE